MACGTDEASPDLPPGWETSERVERFSQTPCRDGAAYEVTATVTAEVVSDGVQVDYRNAVFRCSQAVEGFQRTTGTALEVLVQPADMEPESVTKCDCLYDIALTLAPDSATAEEVVVYRRGDNINRNNVPEKVGTSPLVAP